MRKVTHSLKAVLASAALLGVAACGGEEAPAEYEADVTDESGGELVVEDADAEADAVDVTLPETEMTSVPPEDAQAAE
jgi:ABC-type glycerol-3-phosphate transport system substrate-binding protein